MDWDKNIDSMNPGEFNKVLKAVSRRIKETRLEDRLSRMLNDLMVNTGNTPESVAEKMGCKVELVEHIIRKGDGDMRWIASMVHVMGGRLTMDLYPMVDTGRGSAFKDDLPVRNIPCNANPYNAAG